MRGPDKSKQNNETIAVTEAIFFFYLVNDSVFKK